MRNESSSSRVGGIPVRSKVTLRNHNARSTSGLGERPLSLSPSAIKWSIEFTGFGWSQTPEGITEATLQGITRNEDGKLIGYSYDALTNGKVMQWRGEFDFVAGTIKLKVKEVQ